MKKLSILFISFTLIFILFGIVEVKAETIVEDITTDKIVSENSTWSGGILSANLTVNSDVVLTISGTIMVEGDVTINGGGLIERSEIFNGTIIYIYEGSSLTISNMTLDGGAIWSGADLATRTNIGLGGDIVSIIRNYGTLTINDSTLQNNDVGENGGAIRNNGIFTVNDSIIQNNRAGEYGGGILNSIDAVVVMNNTTIQNNIAGEFGGGISNNGILTMNSGIIRNNIATMHSGGGIANFETLNLFGGLITQNKAANCGGILTMMQVNVKGNLNISGNETLAGDASNLILYKAIYVNIEIEDEIYEASNIIIVGELASESNIGISTLQVTMGVGYDDPVETSYLRVVAVDDDIVTAANYLSNFRSDNSSYTLIANNDDNIELVNSHTVTIDEVPYILGENQTLNDIINLSTIKTKTGYLFDKFIDIDGNQFLETTPITGDLVLTTVFISVPQTYDSINSYILIAILSLMGIISTEIYIYKYKKKYY